MYNHIGSSQKFFFCEKHGLTFLLAQDFLNNHTAMKEQLQLRKFLDILATQTHMCILILRALQIEMNAYHGNSISYHTSIY
jgi:hypothetical protein